MDTPSSWSRVAAVVTLLTAVISVVLVAFALPATRSTLHDIPIAVAGPSAVTGRIAAQLQQERPGAFTVTQVADTAAAETAIRNRDVYGAVDLTSGAPAVLTASAGSPVVAQALQQLAHNLGARGAPPAVAVRDLAPLPADDPRGAGLTAGSLPLVLGGILAAALLTGMLTGMSRRLVGALIFAGTGGLALAAVLQAWFGSLGGDYLVNAGVLALSIAATALTVLGLEALLGRAGLALGSATLMLVGNPLSGVSSAPEMLPDGWGTIGQLMPPGAAASLLRSTAYFDGRGGWPHVAVLLCWAAVGAALLIVAAARTARRRAVAPTPRPAPATAVPA